MSSFRELPSVDQVLRNLALRNLDHVDRLPHELVVSQIRSVLAERREALKNGQAIQEGTIERAVEERLHVLAQSSLRCVINATGVILHTNLGRAPLPPFTPIPGYSNLEYDIEAGERGKRDAHIAPLLESLLGKPGIVVNNNAAAVYLVLNELAAGSEVIVSRGELIEIGDGFRIPDIMAQSGAILREVGTTNRTRLEDYQRAITERTRLILRVHPSNFRVSGFTARPELKALSELANKHAIPLYEDLGSGCLADLRSLGIDEPLVKESLHSGASLVSFSCDKLLGGPQAGVISGDESLVRRVRRNPMYRAFRVDKLILQSLETTLHHVLRQDWQSIPALRMILAPLEELHARAQRIGSQLSGLDLEFHKAESAIGGGSTPDQTLLTWTIELKVASPAAFERRLRSGDIPVICRIQRDRIVLDMRTVSDEEEALLIAALRAAS
ncbi:MAG: L-seryl-tRNA(Sec) selenium transferase [Acidobacteriaceae bacterium]|nr:L-seryl-tRNA(Sec) selenium transferase [Acidobacteriaceae bacterium]